MAGCYFCELMGNLIDIKRADALLCYNEYGFAVFDSFPVTKYHTLIISDRHVKTYFELNAEENLACRDLIIQAKEDILRRDDTVSGFNVGMNCGESAGQTIFHCHIHLIPRRTGDVYNPRGGVRNIIPGMGDYKA